MKYFSFFGAFILLSASVFCLSACDTAISTITYRTKAYVTCSSKMVYIVDQTKDVTIVSSIEIPCDTGVEGICISNDKKRVYVGAWTQNVAVIDTFSDNIIATFEEPVRKFVDDLRTSPDDSKLYFVQTGPETIAIFSTSTYSETGHIRLYSSGDPRRAAITPDGSKLYVSNSATREVVVVSLTLEAQIATVEVEERPRGLAVSPDGKMVFVANQDSNTVTVISTTNESVLKTISGFSGPYDVAFTPDGTYSYVTNYSGNCVSRIKSSTLTVEGSPISVQSDPEGIAITSDGQYAYVACRGSDSINKVDLPKGFFIESISVGAGPYEIVLFEQKEIRQ